MKNLERKLVVLFREGAVNEIAMEKLIENLDEILKPVESVDLFCKTHELADRHCIVQNKSKLKSVFNGEALSPYFFIIGKN